MKINFFVLHIMFEEMYLNVFLSQFINMCFDLFWFLGQIFRGVPQIPKWISPGASNLITSILDPNPKTRINIDGIKADLWFKHDYVPAIPEDDKEIYINDDAFFINEVDRERKYLWWLWYWNVNIQLQIWILFVWLRKLVKVVAKEVSWTKSMLFSWLECQHVLIFQVFLRKRWARFAFKLQQYPGIIPFSEIYLFFVLSQDASERRMIFASNHSSKDLFERIDAIATNLGFQIQKRNGKVHIYIVETTNKPLKKNQLQMSSMALILLPFYCSLKFSTSRRVQRTLVVVMFLFLHRWLNLEVWKSFRSWNRPLYLHRDSSIYFLQVFELSTSVCVVELSKFYGDPSLYREVMRHAWFLIWNQSTNHPVNFLIFPSWWFFFAAMCKVIKWVGCL